MSEHGKTPLAIPKKYQERVILSTVSHFEGWEFEIQLKPEWSNDDGGHMIVEPTKKLALEALRRTRSVVEKRVELLIALDGISEAEARKEATHWFETEHEPTYRWSNNPSEPQEKSEDEFWFL